MLNSRNIPVLRIKHVLVVVCFLLLLVLFNMPDTIYTPVLRLVYVLVVMYLIISRVSVKTCILCVSADLFAYYSTISAILTFNI